MMAAPYAHPLFRAVAGDTWRPGGVELTTRALETSGLSPGGRVLDVGCGAGATLALLRGRGFHAVGLDRVTEPGAGPDMLADACRLPLASDVFDAVISECVLSLLPEPQAALRQWARVLRSGGLLLLADVFVWKGMGAGGGCLAGAVPLETTEARLAAAGFALQRWEDHSNALRALAAQLVWNGAAGKELAQWLGGRCAHETSTGRQRQATTQDTQREETFRSVAEKQRHHEATARTDTGPEQACASLRYGYGLWVANKE